MWEASAQHFLVAQVNGVPQLQQGDLGAQWHPGGQSAGAGFGRLADLLAEPAQPGQALAGPGGTREEVPAANNKKLPERGLHWRAIWERLLLRIIAKPSAYAAGQAIFTAKQAKTIPSLQ